MVKLFTPPYRGVLLLILSFIAFGIFEVLSSFRKVFLTINGLISLWFVIGMFIIIFAVTSVIFKEPIVDTRLGLYIFITFIVLFGGGYAASTWGWQSNIGYLIIIIWTTCFYYILAITPFSNKNVQPVKFIYSIHNKIPHDIPPPLPPDYESPQMRVNKFLHKIFPFYSKSNSPNPESLLIKPEQPQIPRYITTIDDIDIMEGREFERFLKKLFENMGYSAELTNHTDMGADLIISKSGERVSVQAKRWSANVGNDAIQAVVGSLKVYKTQRGMVVTSSDFTNPAIYQAHHNHVELWNRDKLIEMINKYPVTK